MKSILDTTGWIQGFSKQKFNVNIYMLLKVRISILLI